MTDNRCDCTTAGRTTCAGDDWYDRMEDGGCGCPCHSIYSDDPEHWQPLVLRGDPLSDAELADIEDWLARMDAAEALITEDDES